MDKMVEIVLWLILAAMAVLVVMNPEGFKSAVTSAGGVGNQTLSLLSGSGYRKAA